MRTIIKLFICHLFIFFQFLLIDVSLANEWGLEEQPVELDKCDSVILHYDGKTWNHVYYGFDTRLTNIYGFSDSDIFAVGVPGVILHYDGKSWTHKESHITYRLNSIWGSSN